MNTQNTLHCPDCHSTETAELRTYHTVNNGGRLLYICKSCERNFSETAGTPMEGIKSPISKVASTLKIRSEGMGLRATGCVFGIDKKTVTAWDNASLRGRNSTFRRRANTYAKTQAGLQRTLDVHMLIHNFVRPHWTTGEVPAVALGCLKTAF